MATKPERQRHWAGYGAFYIGMGVIGAATVLNIAYDRLPGVGAEMMPQFLSHMYDTSGKGNVTAVFVALGLSIILLGFAMPKGGREQRTAKHAKVGSIAVPLFTAEDENGEEPGVSAAGTVVLRTQKYVSPNSGLSGVTGWAQPRQS